MPDNVYVSAADANAALSAECLYHDAVKLKFYTGTEIFIDIQFLHFCVNFWTGITEWCIFNALLNLLSPFLPANNKLSKFSMVLMFLMKLRLSLNNEDLAYRFGTSISLLLADIFIQFLMWQL